MARAVCRWWWSVRRRPSATATSSRRRPGKIIVDFLAGRFPAYVDTGLNLIDVRDVAAGHLLAAERGRPGERYILANANLTLKELLATLAQHRRPVRAARAPAALGAAGHRPRRGADRAPPRARAARPARRRAHVATKPMFFDGSKAVRELGLPQSPIEPALRRAVEWFTQRGYVCSRKPLRAPFPNLAR